MPTDVMGFVHSAGRTARQGREGIVSCLVRSHAEAGRFRDLHALQAAAPFGTRTHEAARRAVGSLWP